MSEPVKDAVISTRALRKVFTSAKGQRVAVDNLDLDVPAGGVHGFLGPNGSGKTTTIRMLLGLASASSGSMQLFGTPVPSRLPEVIGRVGAVVESPKFAPHLSGRRNLMLLARTIGLGVERVDEVLDRVSLAGRDQDAFRTYSLGMKQRLAIAGALLKRPHLLILDEPTNGLDPAGIREIRDTIRDLAAGGVTVLLSSHILAEVQQVCTSATIIGHGRMLASGPVAQLLASADESHRVVVHDLTAAHRVLVEAGFTVRPPDPESPGGLVVDGSREATEISGAAQISRALGRHELWVEELTPVRIDLETYFLELTRDQGLGEDR